MATEEVPVMEKVPVMVALALEKVLAVGVVLQNHRMPIRA